MNKSTLVIGSNDYLGQQVTKLSGDNAFPTYRNAALFGDAFYYDFYQDQMLPVSPHQMVIIFTAAVEMNQTADKLEQSMKRLLAQVSGSRFIYISSDAVFDGNIGINFFWQLDHCITAAPNVKGH